PADFFVTEDKARTGKPGRVVKASLGAVLPEPGRRNLPSPHQPWRKIRENGRTKRRRRSAADQIAKRCRRPVRERMDTVANATRKVPFIGQKRLFGGRGGERRKPLQESWRKVNGGISRVGAQRQCAVERPALHPWTAHFRPGNRRFS